MPLRSLVKALNFGYVKHMKTQPKSRQEGTDAAMKNRIQMVADDQFLADIDDWRAQLRPVPSRSEAIRRLVYIGLKERS